MPNVGPLQASGPSVGPVALPAANSAGEPSPAPSTPTTVYWDKLDATGSYSSSLISVEQAVLTRDKTLIHISGQLEAHRISRRREAFDDQATINASAQVQNAPLTDLLSIAAQRLPLTGTVNLQVHAAGTLGNLSGGGNLALQGGEFEGLPYHSLSAALSFVGTGHQPDEIHLSPGGRHRSRERNLQPEDAKLPGKRGWHELRTFSFPAAQGPPPLRRRSFEVRRPRVGNH